MANLAQYISQSYTERDEGLSYCRPRKKRQHILDCTNRFQTIPFEDSDEGNDLLSMYIHFYRMDYTLILFCNLCNLVPIDTQLQSEQRC